MTDRPEFHTFDWGVPIVLTVRNRSNNRVMDLSQVSTITFLFQKPNDGTVYEKTGALYTNGEDGKVQWVVTEGFLDEAGEWSVQVILDSITTEIYTDIEIFTVGSNITAEGS